MLIDELLRQKVVLHTKGTLPKAEAMDVQPSEYKPSDEVKEMTALIVDFFQWSDNVMREPRREWNDLSTLSRMMVDQMSFNIYQPNNGNAYPGDLVNSWKSRAMRPVVRNKVMSIASHATARMLFPKVFARNEQSESQEEAAMVMRDLMEYASDQNDYNKNTLYAVISACFNPVSITHIEYADSYRLVKTEKVDGKWQTEQILDEDNSGFILTPVAPDEFFIEDFYGGDDIQKHDRIIWRRVQSYSAMQGKYGDRDNFKYVTAGVQVLYNDANTSFYNVYDPNLRSSLCEEIIFYCKSLDLQIALVNGVMMDAPDSPNPRMDKRHPFICFGYENLDEGKCFYKKSLAFKMQPDASIINTLYPMIIDSTYLNLMPPLIITGEEELGSEVIIPGVATTLINPEASVTPLRVGQDIRTGMETLLEVERSVNESAEDNLTQDQSRLTAYQTSVEQQNLQTLLGPFITMISAYVKQYGQLIQSDILQYMTVPEASKIIDNDKLVFKTFIVQDRKVDSARKTRRISFDGDLKDQYSSEEELNMSYDLLEAQGGEKTGEEICKVNPWLFRSLKFTTTISPDVLNPMSDEMEKALGLELFDRSIQLQGAGVNIDMDKVAKDFLFGLYPNTRNDPDKYFLPEQPIQDIGMGQQAQQMGPNGQTVNQNANMQLGQNPKAPSSPLARSGRVSPMAAARNNPVISK